MQRTILLAALFLIGAILYQKWVEFNNPAVLNEQA